MEAGLRVEGWADKTPPPSDHKQLLRDDDDLLRHMFSDIMKAYHSKLALQVDDIYRLSQIWCKSQTDVDFEVLEKYLCDLKPEEAILVASSFSHMLNLHNLTEDVANTQTERAARMGEIEVPTRSTNKSVIKLTQQNNVAPEEVYKHLCSQTVDLVLTAHPTQAFRNSLLKKYARVRRLMDELHTTQMSNYERKEAHEAIRAQVQAAWRTDEIRRQKPTPQDEMRHGLGYFQQTIFDQLPVFHRRVDTTLANIGQPRLPLEHTLFQFGSWMGGDRDGNPNVTYETTRDVCILARLEACNAYFLAVEQLMFDLSMWRANSELKAYARKLAQRDERDPARVSEERKKRNYADFWTPISVKEPFRVVLSHLRDRMWITREVLHQCLTNTNLNVRLALEDSSGFDDKAEFFRPLKLMYESLQATGDGCVADHRLLDLLRQVQTFGMCLMQLDVRQESTRHTEMMDAITQFLGLGSYAEWEEERRMSFLLEQLRGRRPLLPPGMDVNADVREVIDTFRVLSELPYESLGAYIISMARTASDVLIVVLMQRECGMKDFMRVVPLFETLEDLKQAPLTMDLLLGDSWYHQHINGKQECMIGYSDSGKDAGRLAAAWSLYETQQKISAVAKAHNVQLTLFHGRGGTVGRGGGPTHLAIRSQPPGTIQGKLRVTVQGETIEQQFGERELCFRTLDLYTSAVLEACLDQPVEADKSWIAMMDKLSKKSCEVYRSYVFHNPLFIEYFQTATPVGELGRLNIGSRPSSRAAKQGIAGLRAIPWVFAWTQTRFHLPVWLGVGDALQEEIDAGNLELLQEMYVRWPFFKGTLDLVEMVMAKADPRITAMYDRKLARKELWALGDELRAKFDTTKQAVLQVVQHAALLTHAISAIPELDDKIRLRAPYVTPLNVLQVMNLRNIRDFHEGGSNYRPDDQETLDLINRGPLEEEGSRHPYLSAQDDCLLITIKGIAAGMQNTG